MYLTGYLVNSENPVVSEDSWTIHDSNVALHECLSKRCPPIPNEIILQILGDSTRWIRTKVTLRDASEGTLTVGTHLQNQGQEQILRTGPLLSQEISHLRRIIFTFTSCDQGWSGEPQNHGTYHGSCTWMEASLEGIHRALHTTEPGEDVKYELQRNRHAGKKPESYGRELGLDHKMLQQIRPGDSVVLWGRARYPMWENRVDEARIEVWCMDDLSGIMESTL